MAENDRRKITIRIADLPAYSLLADEQEEEEYRLAAKEVTSYLNAYRGRVKSLDKEQQISIVALTMARRSFQYQRLYEALAAEREAVQKEQRDVLTDFEQKLDKILLDIEPGD